MKIKRVVPVLPETRKTRRMRARYNMQKAGYTRLNKGESSVFARLWRQFADDKA